MVSHPMQVRQRLYYNFFQDSFPHLQLPDSLHLVQQLVVYQPSQPYLYSLYNLCVRKFSSTLNNTSSSCCTSMVLKSTLWSASAFGKLS